MKVTFQACIFTGSIIFLFSGFIALFVGEPIRDYIISKQFILTPDSNLFKSWQKSSEIPQEFYFFNWTNPEDIYNASVKPKFKQVGPYKYTQVFQKENIQWNTNGTVSFQQNKFWYFKNGALNDKINTVNPIILVSEIAIIENLREFQKGSQVQSMHQRLINVDLHDSEINYHNKF